MAKKTKPAVDHHSMTDEEKQDDVIYWLTTCNMWLHDDPPFHWKRVGGLLVVAAVDEDGRPFLIIYREADLAPWYDRAAAYMAEHAPEQLKEERIHFTLDPFRVMGSDFGEWTNAFDSTKPEQYDGAVEPWYAGGSR